MPFLTEFLLGFFIIFDILLHCTQWTERGKLRRELEQVRQDVAGLGVPSGGELVPGDEGP